MSNAAGELDNGIKSNAGGTGKQNAKTGATGISGRGIVIDPGTVERPGANAGSAGGDDSNDRPRRKYTRRGSASTGTKETPLDLNGIESILFSIHGILAAMTKQPLFAIDKSEATMLAEAIGKVGRHYNVEVAAKTMDWVNLGTVMCAVYGTRVFAARMTAKPQRPQQAQQPAPNKDNVVHISGVGDVEIPPGGLQ
jgi:hypothetical protein